MNPLIFLVIFVGEFVLLYFLSRDFTRNFSSFLFMLTHSPKAVVVILAFLFFPGTLIHELAHAFTARLLFVHVGKIELKPERHEDGIKLGSAQIGTCDPIRRMLIGFAPVFWGLVLLFVITYFTLKFIFIDHMYVSFYLVSLISYLVFSIANTMFSSKKDMEGTLEALGIIFLVALVGYFTHAYSLFVFINPYINYSLIFQIFKMLDIFLVGPLLFDFILWLIFKQVVKT